jgi:hypothetical protein
LSYKDIFKVFEKGSLIMRTKYLLWMCLVSVILAGVGCRKKSPPPQEVSKPKVELSEQTTAKQAVLEKPAQEAVSVKAGSEQAQPEEITLSRLGVSVSVQTKAVTIETIEGEPLGFELEQALGMMVTKTIGTVDEQGKVTVRTGQQQRGCDCCF